MTRGFTLLELMVTITVMALVATMVAPVFSDDHRLRVMAASSILASDIEFAQVMTISYPKDPVIVRFDIEKQNAYWLAYADDPETPLQRTSGEPYRVEFGLGRASSADGVQILRQQVKDATLQFDSQGGLVDFTSQPVLTLSRGGQGISLAIAPTTGSVTETDAGELEIAK